jgi:diguanylate cyclase (GGDEF)-like protein
MTEKLFIEPAAPSSAWGADAERQAMLGRTGVLDRGPEPEFDRWTTTLAADSGAAVAALALVDGTRMFVKSLSTADGAADEVSELSLSESLAEHLIGRAAASGSGQPPACAEAPIHIGGQLLGWMAIADDPDRTWDESDLRSLQGAAAAVTTELRLRLADREAARMHDLVASHNRLHDLIARDAPLRDVLSELVEGIERYEPSVIPCVLLLDRDASTLHPGAAPSLPPHYLAAVDGVIIGPNIGTCGSAAWSGEMRITEDIGEDPKWAPIRDFAMDAGLRHCWSMPIKAADGGVLGTFALYGPAPRYPLPEHVALMRDGARLAGIAIERHQTMEKLIHDARYDGLTGLPNRRAIFERLELALGRTGPATKVAVLFVDLDGLKTLNDTLGHDRADDMIRELAQRLGPALRVDDFVGRLGGDEFVVIAEEISDLDQATALGMRLLDTTSKPLPGIDRTVVTASVGIALLDGDVDPAEAIRRADTAMYRAKNSGRDRYAVFADTERRESRRPLSLARALRHPEIRNEMSLAFQPVFDAAGSGAVAVEALMRWTSPSFGVVSPREFIPIAESTGTIVPLGAWALRESCETVARIAEQTGRRLELAVNVSAHQVAKPGFAQSVYQTLRHAKYPAELVTLEITETALARADALSARTLGELRSLGVRIVLDDFGTGHSSLMGLNQHPIDGIKIDRAFIEDLPGNAVNSAIVTAVIDMAKALHCTVTAEGVETAAQLDALRALQCERVQGFLLARPMPAEELVTLLRTQA